MRLKLKLGKESNRPPKMPPLPTVCAECQAPISFDDTFCRACHAPVVRRYCPGCSKLVPENTKECPLCGTSAKAKSRDRSGLPVVVILALGGLAAGLYLMTGISSQSLDPRRISPAPPVKLADAIEEAARSGPRKEEPKTVPTSVQKPPAIISDEEGTRLNLKAYELIQRQQYEQAEPLLRQAIESFPPNTTAVAYRYTLYNLGHVLRRTGKVKESVPYLEKCVQLDPTWSKARYELSVAKTQSQAQTNSIS